jgi:hypothetical protein
VCSFAAHLSSGIANHSPPPPGRSAMCFTFTDDAVLEEARRTLELARLAAESLYGPVFVALDADCRVDLSARTISIDTSSWVGRTLAVLYHGYVRAEFDSATVGVTRLLAKEEL